MTPSNIRPLERRCRSRQELFHLEQTAADTCSTASSFGIDSVRGMRGELNQAPSSPYLGKVYFFDSVEHRDMFEADLHIPVAMAHAWVAALQ
jgi:YHS domain-containing protein